MLTRSHAIIRANLAHLDAFFARWQGRLEWVRPRAGSVAFPRLLAGGPIDTFVADLVAQEGVLLLPGSVYDMPGDHFRLGFGRTDLPAALARLDRFLVARLAAP